MINWAFKNMYRCDSFTRRVVTRTFGKIDDVQKNVMMRVCMCVCVCVGGRLGRASSPHKPQYRAEAVSPRFAADNHVTALKQSLKSGICPPVRLVDFADRFHFASFVQLRFLATPSRQWGLSGHFGPLDGTARVWRIYFVCPGEPEEVTICVSALAVRRSSDGETVIVHELRCCTFVTNFYFVRRVEQKQ